MSFFGYFCILNDLFYLVSEFDEAFLKRDSDKTSQASKALMELRSLVLSGEFPALARLRESALAERLGISRTPLRQAMARLVEEGLLERVETGGCRVASFTIDDILDAIEIRGVLEGTAARLAAERGITNKQLDLGYSILAELDNAASSADTLDFERYVVYNAQFHSLIGQLAGSTVVSREVERSSRSLLASPSAFLKGQELIPHFRTSLIGAQAQHRSLFEAIENREGARAEALAREHARLAHRNFMYITSEKPSLATRVSGLALVAT